MTDEQGWCILRTNGRRTLRLVGSLVAAGIEAWAPREVKRVKPPRGKRLIRPGGFVEREAAIMPGFVFAREQHLPELRFIERLPVSPHPDFSVFHPGGRAPIVADSEIAALRQAEERARRAIRMTRHYAVSVGLKVRPTEGAFAGLNGVVETSDGKFSLVLFDGKMRVKIASWLLLSNSVDGASAQMSAAA